MKIKRLPEDVINKIAAGEILHRPFNAVKEIIENSLDAGATSISVTCKDGGLKLLQIQDNGSGIDKEDLDLLCERFATSKIESYEDLQRVQSFGFRGEAMASISHVARLSVTTKTNDSPCAYTAFYKDGKLSPAQPGQGSSPRPCAGNNGTTIIVEDLFYNIPTRRNSFKNANEEYMKIVDIATKYAIHYFSVGFTCRKAGSSSIDLCTRPCKSVLEAIKQTHQSEVYKELLEFDVQDESTFTRFHGLVSHANFHQKKAVFVFFINGRYVESNALKKACCAVYSRFLPKGTHPWVYLSLSMPSQRVDVNVHPTKKEVHFLDEDEIIDALVKILSTKLTEVGESRKFQVHRLSSTAPVMATPSAKPLTIQNEATPISVPTPIGAKSTPAHKLVRTDPKERRLESYSVKSETTPCKVQSQVELTSIQELRQDYLNEQNEDLCDLFKNHTFVGVVDETRALVQYQTKLIFVNYKAISEFVFYEMCLNQFSNFESFDFVEPVELKRLLDLSIKENPFKLPEIKDDLDLVVDFLNQKAAMLFEYFGITIEGPFIVSLPVILQGWSPCMNKLPAFIHKLYTEVDWESEKECFFTVSNALAWFYSPTPQDLPADLLTDEPWKKEYRQKIEHCLFACFRKSTMVNEMTKFVMEIAELGKLYRIFERC